MEAQLGPVSPPAEKSLTLTRCSAAHRAGVPVPPVENWTVAADR